jgi:hypothetical protein
MLSITLKIKDCVLVGNQVWQLKEITGSRAIFYVAQNGQIELISLDEELSTIPYESDGILTPLSCRIGLSRPTRISLYIHADPSVKIVRFGHFKQFEPIKENYAYSKNHCKKAG